MIRDAFHRTQSVGKWSALTPIVIVVGFLLAVHPGSSQVVRPEIRFHKPAHDVVHDADALVRGSRSHIALVRSQQMVSLSEDQEISVDLSVYQWELFLSGLRINYSVLTEKDLNRSVPDRFKIMILPDVESLSDRQASTVLEFLHRGGGVIASGKTGFYDETGYRRGGRFLETAFGVRYESKLPDQPYGMLQSVESRSDLTMGIPPGFRFNLIASDRTWAATALSGTSLGQVYTYTSQEQSSFEGKTLVASGRHGEGRYLWLAFSPQQVARIEEQQSNYQRLMINAIARFSNSRSAGVALWPNGDEMALVLAALPTPGFDPLTYLANTGHLLDLLIEKAVPASFYLASNEISTFPNLYREMIQSGSEIGITADSDDLLLDQTDVEQTRRIQDALTMLRINSGHGVYPPGGFIDPNSIRTLHAVNAAYVIGPRTETFVPQRLDWWDYADYREPFIAGSEDHIDGTTRDDAAVDSSEMPDISVLPLALWEEGSDEKEFQSYSEAGGLYVVPFYNELYAKYSRAFSRLELLLDDKPERSVWNTTAADALKWWRMRTNLITQIASSRQNELTVQLENTSNSSIENVVLELFLEPGILDVEITGAATRLTDDRRTGAIRLLIPAVEPRGTRVELSWRRP